MALPSVKNQINVRKFLTFGIPQMITSKLTSKAQTTIPQAVRTRLGLREGDVVGFIFENDKVVLIKAGGPAADDPFATFSEWDSEADRRAYAGL